MVRLLRIADKGPVRDRVRAARSKIEGVLAALFAISALITAISPRWIEALGLEPDAGDSSAEWAVVLVLGVAALTIAALARSHRASPPRQRSIEEGSRS